MTNQLILIESEQARIQGVGDDDPKFHDREVGGAGVVGVWVDPAWNEFRLDDHSRALARAGIAAARQALADAVRRSSDRQQVAA